MLLLNNVFTQMQDDSNLMWNPPPRPQKKCLPRENVPYLRKSSAHPFRGFLDPKNRVRITIDGALDAHAKSETMISLSVGSL